MYLEFREPFYLWLINTIYIVSIFCTHYGGYYVISDTEVYLYGNKSTQTLYIEIWFWNIGKIDMIGYTKLNNMTYYTYYDFRNAAYKRHRHKDEQERKVYYQNSLTCYSQKLSRN